MLFWRLNHNLARWLESSPENVDRIRVLETQFQEWLAEHAGIKGMPVNQHKKDEIADPSVLRWTDDNARHYHANRF